MQKQNRLALRRDFAKVYRFGKSVANHQFVVYQTARNDDGPLRVGISISKKVGKAVMRNRIRRKMKEIIRLCKDDLKQSRDIVLIVRKPVADMDYHQIQKSLYHVFRKAELFDQNNKRER